MWGLLLFFCLHLFLVGRLEDALKVLLRQIVHPVTYLVLREVDLFAFGQAACRDRRIDQVTRLCNTHPCRGEGLIHLLERHIVHLAEDGRLIGPEFEQSLLAADLEGDLALESYHQPSTIAFSSGPFPVSDPEIGAVSSLGAPSSRLPSDAVPVKFRSPVVEGPHTMGTLCRSMISSARIVALPPEVYSAHPLTEISQSLRPAPSRCSAHPPESLSEESGSSRLIVSVASWTCASVSPSISSRISVPLIFAMSVDLLGCVSKS